MHDGNVVNDSERRRKHTCLAAESIVSTHECFYEMVLGSALGSRESTMTPNERQNQKFRRKKEKVFLLLIEAV